MMKPVAGLLLLSLLAVGCSRSSPEAPPAAASPRNLVVVTIDTLRADRVGAYGYGQARTPAIDGLAARGVRFERAYAAAPITQTSHATLMTGRYPHAHGARHNGMRLDPATPTLAEALARAGFATGGFIAAFPLDRRFGLARGFETYSDRMPRGAQGRPASERPGQVVVDEAIEWLSTHRARRFFLWVHLFEPHAPYGDPGDRRPAAVRYDDEIAEADRQTGRLLQALGEDAASTLVVVTADHGEAFGEHGEIAHSIFIYDTTLRVPLVIAGPALSPRLVRDPVGLVDLAPTLMRLLGVAPLDGDGIDLGPALAGRALPDRLLYAESFAPLLDFGWSPLRSVRLEGWKFIAAPRPELYEVRSDEAELHDVAMRELQRAAKLNAVVDRMSPASLPAAPSADPEARARLQALGYLSGGGDAGVEKPDPKDKRALAAKIAQVTSGELQGKALEQMLQEILREDPQNPQAHVRLGFVLVESNRCVAAEPHFQEAIAHGLPSTDAHLGLASCQAAAGRFGEAATILADAEAIEPDNPVILANRGIVLSDGGQPAQGIPAIERALGIDPDFHEARFNLAVAFARVGDRDRAAVHAREVLRRLPAGAPQRAEVARLLAAVQ